jgi:hypothetical protein
MEEQHGLAVRVEADAPAVPMGESTQPLLFHAGEHFTPGADFGDLAFFGG